MLLTYLLGRRVAGVGTGTIAALLMATSPTMLFWLMMPMTDVIVATLWLASLLLAFRPSTWSIICSGAVGGLAILVRPNLLPLIAIPFLIALWNCQSGSRRPVRRGLLFIAAVAPSLIIVAAVNSYLYGSTTESGYGSVSSIYSVANLDANLKRYPVWLLESQGILVFIFLIALFKIRRADKDEVPWRGIFLLFIALMLVPYLLYTPFDVWWFLRFLLPAFPLIFILTADGLLWMTSPLSSRWRPIAIVTGCAWMVFHGLRFSQEHAVSGLGRGEQRYADVGHFIAQQLPAKSVCLAMQHSGSIRYYSHCMPLRYDICRRSGWTVLLPTLCNRDITRTSCCEVGGGAIPASLQKALAARFTALDSAGGVYERQRGSDLRPDRLRPQDGTQIAEANPNTLAHAVPRTG